MPTTSVLLWLFDMSFSTILSPWDKEVKSSSFICSYQCPGDKLRIYRNISLSKSGTSQYTLGMCLDRHVSTRFSFRDPGNGRKTVDRLEGEKWPKICRNWISSSFLSILLCGFFFPVYFSIQNKSVFFSIFKFKI